VYTEIIIYRRAAAAALALSDVILKDETAVEELHYPIHFFCTDGRACPFHRTFVTIVAL
jgi:hypothetical protein